jgi:predicted PurR-regulated permease PerM
VGRASSPRGSSGAPPMTSETTPTPRRGRVPYRVILASIWLTIASIASLGLVYKLHDVVFDLVLAAFIALVLNPVVIRLQRVGMGRGPAILAVTAAFFLVFVGLGAAIAAPITSQGVKFARQAPQYLKQAQEGKGPVGAFAKRFHLEKQLRKAVPAISKSLSNLPAQVVGVLRSAATTAFRVAIVIILAIFLLIEGPALVGAFMAGVPPGKQESLRAVGQTTSRVVSGYTIGVVALGVLNGLVTALALAVMGVPFVSSLAVWAAVVDVLPIVGGLIAIVPAALFSFAHSVVAGVVVVAVMFAYQQVKNHVLYPLAVGRAVQLSALLVLVAVLAGSTLMGIPGALLAIPIAGALHAIIVEFAPAPVRMFLRHPELSHSPSGVAPKAARQAMGTTADEGLLTPGSEGQAAGSAAKARRRRRRKT